MNSRKFFRTLVAACTFAAAAQAHAVPTFLVNSAGILTGANNVNVSGTLYNVTFADGSCYSLFDKCTPSSLPFATQAEANLAAQALLDQVFVDGPSGLFDSTTDKTLGCTETWICQTTIPYALVPGTKNGITYVSASYVNNYSGSRWDSIILTGDGPVASDSTGVSLANFAVFQLAPPPVADVPEPGTIILMGVAMAGLASVRRKARN